MEIEPFLIERWYERYEFTTELMLSSSDCESWAVRELLALEPDAMEALLELRLGYTETPGAPELRAAVAARHVASASRQTSSCSRPPRRRSSSPCTRSCVPATTP